MGLALSLGNPGSATGTRIFRKETADFSCCSIFLLHLSVFIEKRMFLQSDAFILTTALDQSWAAGFYKQLNSKPKCVRNGQNALWLAIMQKESLQPGSDRDYEWHKSSIEIQNTDDEHIPRISEWMMWMHEAYQIRFELTWHHVHVQWAQRICVSLWMVNKFWKEIRSVTAQIDDFPQN